MTLADSALIFGAILGAFLLGTLFGIYLGAKD